jgi:hypothetical protein
MKTLDQAAMTAPQKEIYSLSQRHSQTTQKFHLLSIGSINRSDLLHDALLESRILHPSQTWKCEELWLIPDYRELWVIPKHEVFHVAILHDTLSPFELDEACRFIRRQWPHTRILVICAGEDFLEDSLYEDRVMPDASPEALITAIEHLVGKA